jgi:general secretion pathway protein G
MRRARAAERGMTLIEIMVVIAILGMMATAVTMTVIGNLQTAKVQKARLDCRQLETSLELYFTRFGKYPSQPPGLEALVQTQIIKFLQLDPWGNPYGFRMEDGSPVVFSLGADGQPGGDGFNADITSRDPPH